MSETTTDRSIRHSRVRMRIPLAFLHCSQLLFAVIILGLSAYEIRYAVYSVLVFSLIVAIFTIVASSLLLILQLVSNDLNELNDIRVSVGVHVVMLFFWTIDLVLVASIDRTPYNRYLGTLIVKAVSAALEVMFWAIGTGILVFEIEHRHPIASQQDAMSPRDAEAPISIFRQTSQRPTLEEQWETEEQSGPRQETAQPILPDSPEEGEPFPAEPLRVVNEDWKLPAIQDLETSRFLGNSASAGEELFIHLNLTNGNLPSVPRVQPPRIQAPGEKHVVNIATEGAEYVTYDLNR